MNNPPGHIPGLHHPGSIVPINPPGHIPGYHGHGTLQPMPPPVAPNPVDEATRRELSDREDAITHALKVCVGLLLENSPVVQQTKTETEYIKRPFWRGGGGSNQAIESTTGVMGASIGTQAWETNGGGPSRSAESGVTKDGRIFPLDRSVVGRNGAATRRIYGSREMLLSSIAAQLTAVGVTVPKDQRELIAELESGQRRTALINRLW